MKMADILRQLADKLDSIESGSSTQQMKPVDVDPGPDGEGEVMIPPLQAKLELMKRSEGMPNAYDDDDQQLNAIKKNAGVMQQEMSDDEPLDN